MCTNVSHNAQRNVHAVLLIVLIFFLTFRWSPLACLIWGILPAAFVVLVLGDRNWTPVPVERRHSSFVLWPQCACECLRSIFAWRTCVSCIMFSVVALLWLVHSKNSSLLSLYLALRGWYGWVISKCFMRQRFKRQVFWKICQRIVPEVVG